MPGLLALGAGNEAQEITSVGTTLSITPGNGTLILNGDTEPGSNLTHNLGSSTSLWAGVYTGLLVVDNLQMNANTLSSTTGNIVLNATSNIVVTDVTRPNVNDTIDLGTTSQRWQTVYTTDLDATGLSTLATVDINGGNIDGTVIGQSTAAGATFTQINVDNLFLNGNTLSSTDTNGDIFLAPNGSGDTIVDSHLLPSADITMDLGSPSSRWQFLYSRNAIVGQTSGITGRRNVCIGVNNYMTGDPENSLIVGNDCTLNNNSSGESNAMLAARFCQIQGGAAQACAIVASETSIITQGTNQRCAIIGGISGAIDGGVVNGVLIQCSNNTVTLGTSGRFLVNCNNHTRFNCDVRPESTNTFNLGSSGLRWATIFSNNPLDTSDVRLKTDIAPLERGLTTVLELNPVSFRWKSDVEQDKLQKKQYGLIAQEVELVDADLVRKPTDYKLDPDNLGGDTLEDKLEERMLDYRSINYGTLVPLLINAVKQLKGMVDSLQQELALVKQDTHGQPM